MSIIENITGQELASPRCENNFKYAITNINESNLKYNYFYGRAYWNPLILHYKKSKKRGLRLGQYPYIKCELYDAISTPLILNVNFTDIFSNKKRESRETLQNIETRKQIGLIFGITKLPPTDIEAIDRLSGKIASSIKLKEVDSVELVQEVRGN